MKLDAKLHQLSTGHGAFLNVEDYYLFGGFAVWSGVLNPETEKDTSVMALCLYPATAEPSGAPGFRVAYLVTFDTLALFRQWLASEYGDRFALVYLITPKGLEVVKTPEVKA